MVHNFNCMFGGKEIELWSWTICRQRNRIAFDNEDISVNRMKSSFLCNLWSWTNLYIVDRPRSLVDFFDLVGV